MSNTIKTLSYFKTEEAALALKELEMMVNSPDYITVATYSPSSSEPMSFVDKHVKYLSTHRSIDYRNYISNLKLMTKVR